MNACAMGSLTSGEQGVGQCANGETKWRQPVASSACCLPQGSRSLKMLPTSSSEPNLQHRGEQACAGKRHDPTRREAADSCSSKCRCTYAAELSAQQLLGNQAPATSIPPAARQQPTAASAHPAGEVIIRRTPSNSGPAAPPNCCCFACGWGLAAPVAALGLPPASGMLGGGPRGVGAAGKGSRRWAAGAG